jgi:hypothetical protein
MEMVSEKYLCGVVTAMMMGGMIMLCGCDGGTGYTEPASVDSARQKTLAGSWERQDNGLILVLAEDGTVEQESCVFDSTQFIPCDGESHVISAGGSSYTYVIDPYHVWVDIDGGVTMETHGSSMKMGAFGSSGDIGGTGAMVSDTEMTITLESNGMAMTVTFKKQLD